MDVATDFKEDKVISAGDYSSSHKIVPVRGNMFGGGITSPDWLVGHLSRAPQEGRSGNPETRGLALRGLWIKTNDYQGYR